MKCVEAQLHCHYLAVPQRKGPKGRTAPVLSALRAISPRFAEASGLLTSPHCTSASPTHLVASHSVDGAAAGGGIASSVSSCQPRRPAAVLSMLLNLFAKHLHPIMPVFDIAEALHSCTHVETITSRRYTFLLALCAATHLQLKLDANEEFRDLNAAGLGESLLAEARRTLCDFDPVENPTIESILTCFFLFSCYGNLNKQDHAWHNLSQSISFAISLNLHDERAYVALPHQEGETRRTIFWLLFVTER